MTLPKTAQEMETSARGLISKVVQKLHIDIADNRQIKLAYSPETLALISSYLLDEYNKGYDAAIRESVR